MKKSAQKTDTVTQPDDTRIDRRTFVKTAAIAGAGLAIGPAIATAADPASAIAATSGGKRRRYAIVGCGGRHRMYLNAILGQYKDVAELVAVCDINQGRAEADLKVAEKAGVTIKAYHPAKGANPAKPNFDRYIPEFETMVRETKPDVVIVTTTDCAHDIYIVKAMEMGCDAITEKPMTMNAEKCQRILDTKKRTGKNLRVTFNYRYSPPRTQVKDLLMSGAIGDILSVDFQWLLNTRHGADYFRRWHSNKRNSGGLMIHKATHHFDLVNWWLSASPVEVTAVGKREFYTPAMAKRLGMKNTGDRCKGCPEADKCGFYIDIETGGLRDMYYKNENYDGYHRDRCVFRPDIDIEDTMNVVVKYDTGATLSYSLNAFNAWEGYQIAFNGTKGRLEHSIVEQIYMNAADSDDAQGAIKAGGTTVRVIPLRDAATDHKPWKGEGSHGGGDVVMLNDVFLPNPPADKYQRNSDERGGAESILIGAAANISFQTGKTVKIADMVKGLEKPAYPAMPTSRDPVPMPRRLEGNVLERPAPAKKA